MPKLVLTKKEILENIATLVEYLDKNPKHKKFASDDGATNLLRAHQSQGQSRCAHLSI